MPPVIVTKMKKNRMILSSCPAGKYVSSRFKKNSVNIIDRGRIAVGDDWQQQYSYFAAEALFSSALIRTPWFRGTLDTSEMGPMLKYNQLIPNSANAVHLSTSMLNFATTAKSRTH